MEYEKHTSQDLFEDMEDYIKAEKELDMQLIEASELAKKAHQGQKRDEGTPYIEHIERIVKRLKKLNFDNKKLIIAYLHDTLEDTNITYEDLKDKFGGFIADCVKILTKDKKDPNYSFESYLNKIVDSEYTFLVIIKLVDRIDNIDSLSKCPKPEKVKKYIKETDEIFIPIISKSEKFNYNNNIKLLEELKNKVWLLKNK